MNDVSFVFNSPMTKEDWDKLQDNEMEDTVEVTFKTPSGKRVPFRKVKHGEWQEVKRWECSTHSVTDMRCSVCHCYASQVLPHQTTCTYDFCPNCGADMRGER